MKKYLTLSLLFIGINSYAQKVKLQLNLQMDSTYYLGTNASLDIDQFINAAHQDVKTVITGRMSHKVVAIKDTVYELQTEFKSLGMHVEANGQVIEFNSKADEANPMSKIMNTMMDKPFSMFISKSGRVLAIKNIDTVYAGISAAVPNATPEQRAQLKTQMEQSFGEKSIRTNLQDAFVIFPKAEIAIKGTWATNTTLDAPAAVITTKMVYTLDNITADAYFISGHAILASDKTKPPTYKQSAGFMMRMLNITGTAVVKLKLDRKTGWIIDTNVAKNIKGTVQLKDSPKIPGGITYPMVITAVLKGDNL
ncbi:DUF6263 family protein [Mucilaginibacter sp.]|uniref:DUF6263 family protein n=1 Tax=Mucilaginibacter sp. TaxID=1882438 RepID=UPI00326407E7